jgi:hypothetical protein
MIPEEGEKDARLRGKDSIIDCLLLIGPLFCMPTFCTVPQVLLINTGLGDLVSMTEAMKSYVQTQYTRRAGMLENGFPHTYADEIIR